MGLGALAGRDTELEMAERSEAAEAEKAMAGGAREKEAVGAAMALLWI